MRDAFAGSWRTLQTLNAAGNTPENAQGDEHDERRDETVLGEHLPLILIFEKTVDSP